MQQADSVEHMTKLILHPMAFLPHSFSRSHEAAA